MLILTRRVGETLMVGDEVTVTVLGVKGNQVRIGVNAPKDVSVHREEIYQRIQREKEEEEKQLGDMLVEGARAVIMVCDHFGPLNTVSSSVRIPVSRLVTAMVMVV